MVSVFVLDFAVAAARRLGLAACGAGLTTPASASRMSRHALRFAQRGHLGRISCRVVWGERVTFSEASRSGVAAPPDAYKAHHRGEPSRRIPQRTERCIPRWGHITRAFSARFLAGSLLKVGHFQDK